MQKTLLLVALLCFSFNSFAQTVPGDNCENALNLADLTAPYSGSTSMANNDFSLCYMNNSNDLIFYYDVEAGESLAVWQISNNYNSRHTLRWGGTCPGETEIACINDPDTQPVGWTNTTEDTQRVWFILSGVSGSSGDFVLNWQVYPAGVCVPVRSVRAHSISDNTATIAWELLVSGSSWEVIYGPEGFDPESEGEQLVVEEQQVVLNDLLPETTYQAYVRTLCSEELTSAWSTPVRFSTLEFCTAPRPLSVSAITTSSATIAWTDGGNGASWEVEYGPAGFTLGSGTRVEGLEATTVELSDLQHSTRYDWYVRSYCGGDELSDWSSRVSFSTLCSAFELPYMDDFSQGLNPCWQRTVQTGSSSHYLSSERLCFYVRAGENFFSSPEFAADLSAAFLEFDINFSRSGSGEQSFEIGLMSDPDDPATFISLRVIENEGLTSSVQKVRLLLGTVPAPHRYVSFRMSALESGNYIYAYLDNLVLTADPGCYKPWDLRVTDKTEAVVQVEWSSLPTINTWEVIYGLSGFDPSESGSLLALDQSSAVLSDLQEQQDYDVYVRSTCGGELVSDWEGPLRVRLPIPGDDCFSALNLADLTAPYSGSTSVANNDFSLSCLNNSRELVFYYDLEVGESLVVGQVSNNFDSRHTLRWGGTCPGETQIACIDDPDTQPVGWTNTTEDIQRVWFILGGLNSSSSGDFVLDWQVYPADVCVPVRSVRANNIGDNTATIAWGLFVPGSSWEVVYGPEGFDPESEGELLVAEEQQVVLNDLLPETTYQAYVRTLCSEELTSAWSTPVSFSTLEFCTAPRTVSVSSITTASASVSWTDGGNAAEWEVEYGPAGFTLGSGTRVEGLEVNSMELSELHHSTSYDLYVRSLCGGDELSDWSSRVSFSTLCSAFELPYMDDFSQGMNPCWQRHTQTGFRSLQTSSERLRFYVSAGETFFSSPEFAADLSAAFLEFDINFSRSGSGEQSFEIGLMSDPADPATFLSLQVMEEEALTYSSQKVRLLLGTVPATHRYVSFRISAPEADNSIYAYLDNLVLTADPGCYKPWDLRVTDKTEALVQLEWSSLPTQNNWEVIYGLSGFEPSESGSLLAFDQTSVVLSDLQQAQDYDVYVRSTCGDELVSDWEGPLLVRLPIPGDDCFSALDLAELTAPYSGSTSLASNDYSLCGMGSSREMVFYYDLEVGESLVVGQVSNSFDSRHTLRWGGACPGTTEIACVDDPDTAPVGWTNTTEERQRVWFILGGFNSSAFGDFVLDWQVYPAGVCVPVRSVRAHSISDNTATIAWELLVPGSSWEVIYGPEGFDPESEGEQLVVEEQQVVLNDLLPETTYQAYVRTLCGEELASEWSTPVTFNTLEFCTAPRTVSVSSITTASASVSWTDGGNGAEWEVEYGPAGFTPGSGTRVEGLEATSVALSDLQHSTSYDLYVRSLCGGDELSDWSSRVSFSTLCSAFELPYMDDFSQGLNPCWQRHTQTGFTSLQTSSERLRFYVSAGETFFSSPEFDADLSTAFLEFDLSLSRSGSPGERFEIGLMSDPTDPASFVSLEVLENEALTSSNQKVRLLLGTVPATHRYVSFRISTAESGSTIYAYLDNLLLTADPGCYKPWDLHVTDKTEALVQLEWSSLPTQNNWEVIYGQSGFDPSESGTLLALDQASAVLSDLQQAQDYDVYVRSTCGGELVSDWEGPLLVRLAVPGDDCFGALNLADLTAPYSGSTSMANNDFSLCYMNNSRDLIFYYDVEAGAAIEVTQLSNNFDSRHSLRWGGDCPGTTEIACIDEPDTAPVFWYNHTEVTQRVWFILGGYSSYSGDFVLDWTYFEPGSCLPPVDLRVTEISDQTAQLSWTDISNASEWEVRVAMNYGQETLVYSTITSAPMLALEGLEPGTPYSVTVGAICDEGVSSRKVSTSFNTTCGLLTLPYFAEFGQNGKVTCWRFVSNWSSYYYTDWGSQKMYYDLATGVATHALPQVGELLDGAVLRFNISDIRGAVGLIQVGSMSSATDSTSFVPFISRELDANSVNMEIGFELPALPEGHSFLALRLINNSENKILLGIKGFSIQEKSDCEVPAQLMASSVTHDAAQISWVPLGIEAAWELRVGAPGFDPETEGDLYQTESPVQELINLLPDTRYEVVVRPVCTNGAEWSKPYVFSTKVACPAPYDLSVVPASPQSVLVDWALTERAETWRLSYRPVNSYDRQELLVEQAPPFFVEGLTPGVQYTFSVASLCGEDFGNSWASQQVSSFTACDGVKSLPYVGDWSNLERGFSPYCWDALEGSSPNNRFGAINYYHSGHALLEFYVSGSEGYVTALLPELEGDLSAMKMHLKLLQDYGEGALDIGVWDGQDFHLVETLNLVAASSLLKDYVVLLDNAGSYSGRLALRLRNTTNQNWNWLYLGALEVDWQSDCERPFGFGVQDLTSNSATLLWEQIAFPSKVEMLWSPLGFDPAEAGSVVELDGAVGEYALEGLSPASAYEVYWRNQCDDELWSDWSAPFVLNTPCLPLEINLPEVEEGTVFSLEEEVVLNLTYSFACTPKSVNIYLVNEDSENSNFLGMSELTEEEGSLALRLPRTLSTGNYRLELRYTDFIDNGSEGQRIAASGVFGLTNSSPRIEIMRPSANNAVVHGAYSSIYLTWNVFMLSEVDVLYSVDGGENWEELFQLLDCYSGSSFDGATGKSIATREEWLGETLVFKVVSSTNPDVFALSPGVLVLAQNPFRIVSVGSAEVPLGGTKDIEYEADTALDVLMELEDNYFNVLSSQLVSVAAGTGTLQFPTEGLQVGESYIAWISAKSVLNVGGSGYGFTVVVPTSLNEIRQPAAEIQLHPVPVEDLLFIHAPDLADGTHGVLYDLSGRRLMDFLLSEAPLNLSHLKTGVYLLMIDGRTFKVVKE